MTDVKTQEKFSFQAEVGKLLDIVAHSLYSHKEVFLRELISNASDACDKLRYQALTTPALTAGDAEFKINLSVNKEAKTLTISDNGIGMNRDELIETLGTIARSGTEAFVSQLAKGKEKSDKGESSDAVDLIGQFGVGFYSSFMVASKVEVVSRKAGEEGAWLWTSDGRGEFTIDSVEREGRGTDITLFMNDADLEYIETVRIENIIKTYSDHIEIPVMLTEEIEAPVPEGEEAPETPVMLENTRTINTASALWTRSKGEITEEQYKEFYHHAGHAYDDPWLTLHNSVEGMISYTNLLFVPSMPPFDLFNPDRKQHVKLYVKRVFITDDCQELLPSYFRFVRGIIDSEDLPLNVSREMLQDNPALTKIRKGVIKRLITDLKKKAEDDVEGYNTFWDNFGAVLKEGIYEDFENREKLFELARFKTTESDSLVSLEEYFGRMKEGQETIYYITGDEMDTITKSPHLEGFRAKGVEVLLLTDPVDEFWVTSANVYKEKTFKSVTQAGAELSKIKKDADDKDEDEKKPTEGIEPLLAAFKIALGETIKDVCVSERLTESPVCLVAGENDRDIHLERMLKQSGRMGDIPPTARVLEINADHSLIRALSAIAKDQDGPSAILDDAAALLLDQARIIDGENVPDPTAFCRLMSSVMESSLK